MSVKISGAEKDKILRLIANPPNGHSNYSPGSDVIRLIVEELRGDALVEEVSAEPLIYKASPYGRAFLDRGGYDALEKSQKEKAALEKRLLKANVINGEWAIWFFVITTSVALAALVMSIIATC